MWSTMSYILHLYWLLSIYLPSIFRLKISIQFRSNYSIFSIDLQTRTSYDGVLDCLWKYFLSEVREDFNILLLEQKLVLNLNKNLAVYVCSLYDIGSLIFFHYMFVLEPVKFPIMILRNIQICLKQPCNN